MALIKSISGIRGTIGGEPNNNLTPIDVVNFTAAFGSWLKKQHTTKLLVIIGRDARPSGHSILEIVKNTLINMGIHVFDTGLSTTPTVSMGIILKKAQGGIMISASHNPVEWNALKLFNERGEFISANDGKGILQTIKEQNYTFANIQELGQSKENNTILDEHIKAIINLDAVDKKGIEKRNFSIVVDGINSSGAIAVPKLLKALGVKFIKTINQEPNGLFAHNPEPLPGHLDEICQKVREENADLGIVVDPDVDRLAFVDENGQLFGEEYTLVAVADYVLGTENGAAVSNLSSTSALNDIAKIHGQNCYQSAVGEVNVVEKMKAKNAVIGGEGNGGVIYPKLHYGRDALVGIALFLSHLVKINCTVSELKQRYPKYEMSKNKITLQPGTNVDNILQKIKEKYANLPVNTEDGIKILWKQGWVHLRKSNTEPVIRFYAEAQTIAEANKLAENIQFDIQQIVG